MDFRQVAADIQYWLLRLSEFGSGHLPCDELLKRAYVGVARSSSLHKVRGKYLRLLVLNALHTVGVLHHARTAVASGKKEHVVLAVHVIEELRVVSRENQRCAVGVGPAGGKQIKHDVNQLAVKVVLHLVD